MINGADAKSGEGNGATSPPLARHTIRFTLCAGFGGGDASLNPSVIIHRFKSNCFDALLDDDDDN